MLINTYESMKVILNEHKEKSYQFIGPCLQDLQLVTTGVLLGGCILDKRPVAGHEFARPNLNECLRNACCKGVHGFVFVSGYCFLTSVIMEMCLFHYRTVISRACLTGVGSATHSLNTYPEQCNNNNGTVYIFTVRVVSSAVYKQCTPQTFFGMSHMSRRLVLLGILSVSTPWK